MYKASMEDCKYLVKHLVKTYDLFRQQFPVPSQYYWLNTRRLVSAVTNAISDRDRAANYHSTSGASSFKTAAFIGKWLAHDHPVNYSHSYPLNLTNSLVEVVNSTFAAYAVQSLIAKPLYPKLFSDVQYCFEYRALRGEEVNLLLDHALLWAQQQH